MPISKLLTMGFIESLDAKLPNTSKYSQRSLHK